MFAKPPFDSGSSMSKDIPYCCLYRISIRNLVRITISLKYLMIPRTMKSMSRYDTLLGTFGIRRSSKTGFNSISGVQCVNRYPRTKVGIAVDRNNTKVDTEPKVRAGKLRRDSKEWNRLKDEKAI
jgi:hypothetical protein